MDRGTDSINNLLNYILFQIVPTIIDVFVAVIFFVTAFNKWFGLIVFTTMALYIGKHGNRVTVVTMTSTSIDNNNSGKRSVFDVYCGPPYKLRLIT